MDKIYKFEEKSLFWIAVNVLCWQKLAQLEAEEAVREEAGYYAVPKIEMDDTLKEIRELARQIRDKKIIMRQERAIQKNSTKPVVPRTAPAKVRDRSVSRLRSEMEELGVDMSETSDVSIGSLCFAAACLKMQWNDYWILCLMGADKKPLEP